MKDHFNQKVLAACGIVLLTFALAVFAVKIAKILFLVFAAVVIAVFFSTITDLLHKRFPKIHRNLFLLLVFAVCFLIGVTMIAVVVPHLADQMQTFWKSFPETFQSLKDHLRKIPGWANIADFQFLDWAKNQQIPFDKLMPSLFGVFSSTFGAFTSFVFILFISIYLAAEPKFYIEGTVKLFPPSKRKRIREVIARLGHVLRWWFFGQSISMFTLGACIALGLWILGIPFPLILGFFTALMTFIPNFGPIISAIPALLLALTQSPMQALYVFILYLIIQNVEGFLITPYVHRKVLSMPPVLVFFFQIVLAAMIGFLGVLIAMPFVACFMVLIQMLYIEDVLEKKHS